MTNYAHVIDNVAIDVTASPATSFHPEIAGRFIAVPDDVRPGWILNNGSWSAPPPPEPFTPPPQPFPNLLPMQFYMAFKPTERMAIKASTDPHVVEFWATYQLAVQTNSPINPNLVSVVEGLTYLATPTTATPPGVGILADVSRVAEIQAGVPQ